MEAFKAVEKAMKTKAFSKEGLNAQARMDPKERAKAEACDFLSTMVDDLERQIETMEAESESIQATMKKGKSQSAKADRIAAIEHSTERHKWHQGKLELMRRALENGGLETEQVTDLEEAIRYYVTDNMNDDYMEDEEMYDDLALDEEEDAYGMGNDNDKVSSQDTQSIQDDAPETESRSTSIPGGKSKPQEVTSASARRPSQQLKSPLPALATLHTPLSNQLNGSAASSMKPAAVPARPAGETLKYASAAAAAASSVGIAPLPPPPGATPPSTSSIPALPASLPSALPAPSPVPVAAQPAIAQFPTPRTIHAAVSVADVQAESTQRQSPALSKSSAAPSNSQSSSIPQTPAVESSRPTVSRRSSGKMAQPLAPQDSSSMSRSLNLGTSANNLIVGLPAANGSANGVKDTNGHNPDESVYHLPSGFQDLLQSFEITQSRASFFPSQSAYRVMETSWESRPFATDSDAPKLYKPKYKFPTPDYYPQTPLPIFENPTLYSRIDPDTLFYIFYYKQGTYQQYLAAKALKEQSWRFHKQYQTWFQRHEEPKTITDEFEQGTYRFFDYESTW